MVVVSQGGRHSVRVVQCVTGAEHTVAYPATAGCIPYSLNHLEGSRATCESQWVPNPLEALGPSRAFRAP